MDDIINIKEQFKIDDSHSKIRGVVCAYDENDNLVFSKENMIVESGRRYIMKHGINSTSFKYAKLSSEGAVATPSDSLEILNGSQTTKNFKTDSSISDSDFKTNFERFIIKPVNTAQTIFLKKEEDDTDDQSLGKTIGDENYFSYDIDYQELCIRCLIIFNDNVSIEARSLGLVVNDGTNDVLFSRVTFPTYYKSNHQRLTFRYYIYF